MSNVGKMGVDRQSWHKKFCKDRWLLTKSCLLAYVLFVLMLALGIN